MALLSHQLFPKTTHTFSNLPKEKFYKESAANSEIKRLFVDEIDKITITAVIAPRTLNIIAGSYAEIDVIELQLKGSEVNQKVLQTIDEVIPRPVLFCIIRPDESLKFMISYKELRTIESTKSRVVHYYQTGWGANAPTIIGYSVDAIYLGFIGQIDPHFDATKPIHEAVATTKEQMRLQVQIDKLNTQIRTELSLAKKQELARQRHELQNKLPQ